MTKISKILTAATVLGVMGIAVLPVASYADGDVIVSVTVGTQNDTGTCTGAACTGGGNNATGYTATITDKDGAKFNLANNTDVADNSGTSSTGTRAIPTISSPMATIASGSAAGYGVKASANTTGIASGAYTGTYTYAPTALSTSWNPVSATIGTVKSASAGLFNIGITHAEDYSSGIEAGTYTNTLKVVYAAS